MNLRETVLTSNNQNAHGLRRRFFVLAKMNDDQTEKMLIIYRSGGLGDFVKTWGFLRNNRDAIIVTKKDRGDLLRHVYGHEFLCDDTWQPFFKKVSCPPPFVSNFTSIVVYRHEYFAKDDEQIRSGLKSLNSQANVELRSFCPVCCEGTNPEPRTNESGHVIFHVGAGILRFSKAKTADYLNRGVFPIKAWDLKRSLKFKRLMGERGYHVDLIAGPEQRNQWDTETLKAFRTNGSFEEEGLIELKDIMSNSKCFIGFDSGPTHLAAQLGIPTVGMYGPTGRNGVDPGNHDMYHAEPLGQQKHLCLIQPGSNIEDLAKPRMQWLSPEEATDRVQEFLDGIYDYRSDHS